jgi:hypothetical protein
LVHYLLVGRSPLSAVKDGIALLAALRLTRLITRDWLGEWAVVQPAKSWAAHHEGEVDVHAPETQHSGMEMWRTKLVSGLDCPHCVGFHVTFWTLVISRLKLPQPAAQFRDLLLKALAGSYVVGHVSSRFDA